MSPDIIEARLRESWDASARTGRRQRGRQWYPAAREWADQLASETGLTVEQVVAVLAITSPGAQLTSNLRWTEQVARAELDTAGRYPNSNRAKIAAVLSSPQDAHEYVTGPKVGPFHRAILGDTSQLVLDRWAIFAAIGGERTRKGQILTGSARAAIEQAYRALARKVGLTVRDLQAVLWLQVRETTERRGERGGMVPRLLDLT